jgi:hypothetical protein
MNAQLGLKQIGRFREAETAISSAFPHPQRARRRRTAGPENLSGWTLYTASSTFLNTIKSQRRGLLPTSMERKQTAESHVTVARLHSRFNNGGAICALLTTALRDLRVNESSDLEGPFGGAMTGPPPRFGDPGPVGLSPVGNGQPTTRRRVSGGAHPGNGLRFPCLSVSLQQNSGNHKRQRFFVRAASRRLISGRKRGSRSSWQQKPANNDPRAVSDGWGGRFPRLNPGKTVLATRRGQKLTFVAFPGAPSGRNP